MIGNLEEATLIYNWHHFSDAIEEPEGWKRLGAGCFRTAYLSPSGVVYKVDSELHDGYASQDNYTEWQNYRHLYFTCKMPRHSRLPVMSYFQVGDEPEEGVIAIERFTVPLVEVGYWDRGDDFDWWDISDEITEATGVSDLHSENVYLDLETNTLVPVDLGGRMVRR